MRRRRSRSGTRGAAGKAETNEEMGMDIFRCALPAQSKTQSCLYICAVLSCLSSHLSRLPCCLSSRSCLTSLSNALSVSLPLCLCLWVQHTVCLAMYVSPSVCFAVVCGWICAPNGADSNCGSHQMWQQLPVLPLQCSILKIEQIGHTMMSANGILVATHNNFPGPHCAITTLPSASPYCPLALVVSTCPRGRCW